MAFLKKNLTLFIFVSVLGIFLLISVFYLGRTLKENAGLSYTKNKKADLINRYHKKGSFPPSQVLLEYYQDKKEKKSEYYKSFHSLFVSSINKYPQSIPQPLKFKERLFKSQSSILKEAERENLTIAKPALHLGFDKYETEIPQAEDIPDLVMELQAIEELTSLMMQSGILSIEYIRILEPQDKPLHNEKEPFVRLFPVQIAVKANFGSFIEFLNLCGRSDVVFVLSDMHVYQSNVNGDTIKADIVVNQVIFL